MLLFRMHNIRIPLLSVLICFLIVLCLPLQSSSAVIEGIILSEKGPLVNGEVFAYESYDELINKHPSHTSVAGDKKGFYLLDLPAGRYYLTASGIERGNSFFAFHGANPITVTDENLWIPFMVLPETDESVAGMSSAKLSGKVTFKGSPVQGAQVSIYPVTNMAFRGMGFLTSTTDMHGLFALNAEPGEYVIVARKRMNFRGLRPLVKGDLFCYYSSNPLSVKIENNTYVDIPCYPKDDLEAFLDRDIYPTILVKKSSEGSVRFRENKMEKNSERFRITGQVTDLDGNPMKDLYVMAYKGKPDQMFQMLYVRTMPEYMVKTDAQGKYVIEAEKKGTYYMVARELIGEAPAKGENYGLYEGNTDHAVVLERDSVSDVYIVVSKMMTNKNEARARSREVKVVNHEYAVDTVIERDTSWAGDITINGIVHVARGATLTIEPGTSVQFRRIDRNRDGVGDGKIRVSGRLVAEGTPNRMISFSSAEDRPRKMDWSYVLFFVSEDQNIIKYCMFKHAFTGLQSHFSNAVVMDSYFINNHEAIRFGRTELIIEHNEILSNGFGIRYTRLEGPVEITQNNILNNDVGIFHVPSNQNIVDFSETFNKKALLHRHQPVVSFNNIAYNEEYNFRLGERQGYNIMLNDNWWGSSKEKNIEYLIYDDKMDDTLGSVLYKPYFTSPVKDAGMRRKVIK